MGLDRTNDCPSEEDRHYSVLGLPDLKLVGMMHGSEWCAKLGDCFAIEPPTLAKWVLSVDRVVGSSVCALNRHVALS